MWRPSQASSAVVSAQGSSFWEVSVQWDAAELGQKALQKESFPGLKNKQKMKTPQKNPQTEKNSSSSHEVSPHA